SWSVYRAGSAPRLFLSASRGVPDTTRDCWRAYLSGPHRADRTLPKEESARTVLCHLDAQEAPAEHRAKVYDAHGMAERISVAQSQADGDVFAINFYRHRHQRAFTDASLDGFAGLAPALFALVRRHVALADAPAHPTGTGRIAWRAGQGGGPEAAAADAFMEAPPREARAPADDFAARLRGLCPALTTRELAVCLRLLAGMTQDGIASDLGLAPTTVKTYRNRAFARLGIHFRNQLFALMLERPPGGRRR
ncbi:MAG: LuxR family transcriptional regulator, partial [Comamonadaceae bacterium]